MIGLDMPEPTQSLTRRINTLETQITLRRRNVRTVKAGFKRKITSWMVSPVTLLEAFGIGVVMEQTSHHRGWSLATVVNAASASIRLLLAFSSPAQSVNENSTQKSRREFTRQ
jgi:hypothetical protein